MGGREETPEERTQRWMIREAKKADERDKEVRKVKCTKCGKEVDEFMEVAGRALCMDCYEEEQMDDVGAMTMPGEGGGGG
ncbi:MAG: hypothetical protein WAV32_01195 [Halobacteriota archaeon]